MVYTLYVLTTPFLRSTFSRCAHHKDLVCDSLTGGEAEQKNTLRAPASLTIRTISLEVVPRTIESSTSRTDRPSSTHDTAESFFLTFCRRKACPGMMNVRPTYLSPRCDRVVKMQGSARGMWSGVVVFMGSADWGLVRVSLGMKQTDAIYHYPWTGRGVKRGQSQAAKRQRTFSACSRSHKHRDSFSSE